MDGQEVMMVGVDNHGVVLGLLTAITLDLGLEQPLMSTYMKVGVLGLNGKLFLNSEDLLIRL